MKKIGIAVIVLVLVSGGFLMGCIDTPTAEIPEVEVVYINTTIYEVVEVVSVVPDIPEVVEVPEKPYLTYRRVFVPYPENLVGFDTVEERAYIYQKMLNTKMDELDTLTVSQYLSPSAYPVEEFYTGYYQGLVDEYTDMYIMVGSKVMVDAPLAEGWNFSIEEGNSTGNSSA